MKFKLFLLIILGHLQLMAHGGHVAEYKYSIKGQEILLEFSIESGVLDHFSLEKKYPHYEAAKAICLVQYINENSSLRLNEHTLTFELLSAKEEAGYFTIMLIARFDFMGTEQLRVENGCFIEFDRKFENRIILQRDNTVNSYRLNRKKKHLLIDLN